MAPPFLEYLEDIAEELSSPKIWNEERDFETVKNYVVSNLRNCSYSFNIFYKTSTVFGTSAHGTRLYNDDQYDVLLQLVLPSYQKIEMYDNNDNYVKLDVSMIPYNLPMADDKEYINRKALQRWLGDIFLDVFNTSNNYIYGYNNEKYELSYEMNGMWHRVFAISDSRDFSIDFVPAIRIVHEDYPNSDNFHAIPKLMPGCSAKYSFMLINSNWERAVLEEVPVIKKALILLQAMCESKGLIEIRYYHLMHLSLSDANIKFAKNAYLDEVFIELLLELYNAFDSEHLPHFFETNINLLSNLTSKELSEYLSILDDAHNTLSTYHHQELLSYERCNSHFE